MEKFIQLIHNLELSSILRQLKYVLQKRHKNDAHIRFLITAKQHQIIPKFLQIKLPTNKYKPHEAHTIHMNLLKTEIKMQHKNRTLIHTKLKFLHRHLLQHLHHLEYTTLIQDLEEDITDANLEMDLKRTKKLQHLIRHHHDKKTQKPVSKKPSKDDNKHNFHDKFTNLANIPLNKQEIDLLNHGHKFAPVPHDVNPHILAINIEHQLPPHLNLQSVKEKVKNIIINKVSKSYNKTTNSLQYKTHTPHHNNTIKTLKQKLKDHKATMTFADKNAGLVIIDNNTYITKTETFFTENNITERKRNPLNSFIKHTNDTLKQCSTTLLKLNTNVFKLKVKNPTIPTLYSLIKLHKQNLPIRPITSSINSPVQKIAMFLNQLFKNKCKLTRNSPSPTLNI
ncbi:hypothetical protein RI129_011339 [Pyrocoelia pectoralis]|uniref:Uncharacterized protein n=1 Tax=Pyrocoelia pectoralis TaxID=417401 RepID=A0AAN7V5B5_9COLE